MEGMCGGREYLGTPGRVTNAQELVDRFHRQNLDMLGLVGVKSKGKGLLMWPSKRMRFLTLLFEFIKEVIFVYLIRIKKVFEDETLKEGACVRHMETPGIDYWTPAHRPSKRTDPCTQTS